MLWVTTGFAEFVSITHSAQFGHYVAFSDLSTRMRMCALVLSDGGGVTVSAYSIIAINEICCAKCFFPHFSKFRYSFSRLSFSALPLLSVARFKMHTPKPKLWNRRRTQSYFDLEKWACVWLNLLYSWPFNALIECNFCFLKIRFHVPFRNLMVKSAEPNFGFVMKENWRHRSRWANIKQWEKSC